jgi:hypothetical protein
VRADAAAVGLLGALLWALPGAAEELVNTCVSCHAEEEDEEMSEPVEQWRRSVHAEAEVSCDACHGGDPFEEDEELSMDEEAAGFVGAPGWADVPDTCGACHEDIRDGYAQSVMGGLIDEGEEVAVCSTCHMGDGHAIVRPRPREILTRERCGECHDPDRAIELRDLLEETRDRIAGVEAEIQEIHGRIDTSGVDREVREIRQRAVVIAHTYDLERIAQVAAVAHERLEAASAATAELAEEAEFRRRTGAGVVAFLALACVGVIGVERDLRRGSRQFDDPGRR